MSDKDKDKDKKPQKPDVSKPTNSDRVELNDKLNDKTADKKR